MLGNRIGKTAKNSERVINAFKTQMGNLETVLTMI